MNVLVASKAARIVAVHRVVTNKGARSEGLGPKAPRTLEGYHQLIEQLRTICRKPHLYKAKPLHRIDLVKPNAEPGTDSMPPKNGEDLNKKHKGLRPLSIPTIFDRCVQAIWTIGLEPWSEFTADERSYGFRRGRSPA